MTEGFTLVAAVVPRGKAEALSREARGAGAGGGTIVMARGASESAFLRFLALGETSKEIALAIVPAAVKRQVIGALVAATERERKNFGELFTIDAADFFKPNQSEEGGGAMERDETAKDGGSAERELITVIANSGYADDIMDAARAAGAEGGTVINARGTADPSDEKFFGMEIVPEKDMVEILAKTGDAQRIFDAIKALPCLSKPGSGVAFRCKARDFTALGKRK